MTEFAYFAKVYIILGAVFLMPKDFYPVESHSLLRLVENHYKKSGCRGENHISFITFFTHNSQWQGIEPCEG